MNGVCKMQEVKCITVYSRRKEVTIEVDDSFREVKRGCIFATRS